MEWGFERGTTLVADDVILQSNQIRRLTLFLTWEKLLGFFERAKLNIPIGEFGSL